MDVHPQLMVSDEGYRQACESYQAKEAQYRQAFAEDWPDKTSIEQELVQLGQQVAAFWEQSQTERPESGG